MANMTQISAVEPTSPDPLALSSKLWIYTNYDCNLRCKYCVAESHPGAPKRAISLTTVQRIVDEALEAGLENIYFTGGEPFILEDIYEMLAYASEQVKTTVLTNAMLFRGRRLKRLEEIANQNLVLQVSLDGSRPEHHDPYRGVGSWRKTVDGIKKLVDLGFNVRVSTTETSANTAYLEDICEYRRTLGIPDEDHIIRPLAKRGFSQEGMEVGKHNLVPEMTINAQGVYWHPLSTDPDLLVSEEIFPLAVSIFRIKAELAQISISQNAEMEEFQ
jgi:MoaA/NifB/PqqE/SkfB family radical SAM enzyme